MGAVVAHGLHAWFVLAALVVIVRLIEPAVAARGRARALRRAAATGELERLLEAGARRRVTGSTTLTASAATPAAVGYAVAQAWLVALGAVAAGLPVESLGWPLAGVLVLALPVGRSLLAAPWRSGRVVAGAVLLQLVGHLAVLASVPSGVLQHHDGGAAEIFDDLCLAGVVLAAVMTTQWLHARARRTSSGSTAALTRR
ncbi:MAG: hypothetical protein ACTHMS_22620 [Jatrophihabitans sp.]|uniref:hypothetical protein n=1 Tax=Jatrophihabitans sp. TaxID=1932789 RepID=UPI003F8235BE